MSKFQGYAQESRKGFNPINLTDESRKILERADQTIRGMQAVRDADVANTSAYIRSFQDAMSQERQSQSEYNRLLNLNDQTRIDAAKARALENAQRKQQLGERRERIYKALANFSTTAIKAVGEYKEQKFDEEYNTALQELFTQGFADPNASAAYLADKQTRYNLDIIGVSQQATAAAAEANGTSAMEAAELRANDYGLSVAKKKALAVYHSTQFPIYFQNALNSDNETKVKIYGPNGKLVDGTPMQAKGSKNQSIVANQLIEQFLKQTGLYGMKESFLTDALMQMRDGANKIIAGTMRNELTLQRQEQMNTVLEVFQSEAEGGDAASAFHRAQNRLQFMLPGGQKEARQTLFNALKEPRRIVNGVVVGFTQDQLKDIFDTAMMDQPGNPLKERYSREMAEVYDQRGSRETQIHEAEQRADEVAIEKDYNNLRDMLLDDRQDDEKGSLDLTEENIDRMIADYRKMGDIRFNKQIKLLDSMRQYTEQAIDAKPIKEEFENRITLGMADPDEIMLNPVLQLDERLDLARRARESDNRKPTKFHMDRAEDFIKDSLHGRARITLNGVRDRSVGITVQKAIDDYIINYKDNIGDGLTHAQAHKTALADFNEQFLKGEGQDGTGPYALSNYTDVTEGQTAVFKNYEDYLPKPASIEITARSIKEKVQNGTTVDRPIVDVDPLKKALEQIQTGQKPQRVAQIEILTEFAPKKADGSRYSYAEVFVRQAKAHGIAEDKLKGFKSAIELESQVPPRYRKFLYRPTPTNTDIVVIASGGNAVYNRNYKITSTQIQALDLLAKYESAAYARNGDGGYNAMNQGGKDKGRTAINPGHSKDILGENLTDLTVSEIIELQKQGDLHAAGRYQFIGNTLPGVVKDAGVPLTDKFNQRTQDYLGLVLMQQRGIGPWVGAVDKATPTERELIERARQQPLSFGEGVWRQSQNVNPLLRERLTTGN